MDVLPLFCVFHLKNSSLRFSYNTKSFTRCIIVKSGIDLVSMKILLKFHYIHIEIHLIPKSEISRLAIVC